MVVKDKKSRAASPKKNAKTTEPSFFESTKEFLKGVRSEWNKVSWPDKQQITHETLVVIVVTAFFTILIFVIDLILRGVIDIIPRA